MSEPALYAVEYETYDLTPNGKNVVKYSRPLTINQAVELERGLSQSLQVRRSAVVSSVLAKGAA